tara:strand:- start:4326 stop:4604 length:279 start_codon:yes stop_codon:yes gene_type:complete
MGRRLNNLFPEDFIIILYSDLTDEEVSKQALISQEAVRMAREAFQDTARWNRLMNSAWSRAENPVTKKADNYRVMTFKQMLFERYGDKTAPK